MAAVRKARHELALGLVQHLPRDDNRRRQPVRHRQARQELQRAPTMASHLSVSRATRPSIQARCVSNTVSIPASDSRRCPRDTWATNP